MSELQISVDVQSAKFHEISNGAVFQVRNASGRVTLAKKITGKRYMGLEGEQVRLFPVTIRDGSRVSVLKPTHEII